MKCSYAGFIVLINCGGLAKLRHLELCVNTQLFKTLAYMLVESDFFIFFFVLHSLFEADFTVFLLLFTLVSSH